MKAPHGTSVVDVADPRAPRQIAALEVPPARHSHKVRAANGLMLVNARRIRPNQARGLEAGLLIFDSRTPEKAATARVLEERRCRCHRFTFDGRYAYISRRWSFSATYMMILDLADPAGPGSRPLVDAGPVEGRARRRREGPRAAAVIIRSGSATALRQLLDGGFVISTSRHGQARSWSPDLRLESAFIRRLHTALPVRSRCRAAACCSSRRGRGKLEPGRRRSSGRGHDRREEAGAVRAAFQVWGVDGSPQPEFTG